MRPRGYRVCSLVRPIPRSCASSCVLTVWTFVIVTAETRLGRAMCPVRPRRRAYSTLPLAAPPHRRHQGLLAPSAQITGMLAPLLAPTHPHIVGHRPPQARRAVSQVRTIPSSLTASRLPHRVRETQVPPPARPCWRLPRWQNLAGSRVDQGPRRTITATGGRPPLHRCPRRSPSCLRVRTPSPPLARRPARTRVRRRSRLSLPRPLSRQRDAVVAVSCAQRPVQ